MNRAELDKRPRDVASMFDQVAARYDFMNDVMTGGLARWWRVAVRDALDVHPGDAVLDIAAGTGTSSVALHTRGVHVVAADFSVGMLRQGRVQYGAAHPDLPFVAADATALPFADDTFDAVTISYGLRNIADTDAALREFLRVTKPGGRLVIAEFSQPTNAAFGRFYREYIMVALPTLAKRLSSNPESYVYLAESIREWPGQRELGRRIAGVGWSQVSWRNLTGGIVALHRAVKPGAA